MKECIICFGKDKKCKVCTGTNQFDKERTKAWLITRTREHIADMKPKRKIKKNDMLAELNLLCKWLMYEEKE